MTSPLSALKSGQDGFSRFLRLMPLALILIEIVIVGLLYFFAGETTQLEEALRYINATMFLGAVGSVFLVDGHVRVDIFYEKASPKRKALIDTLGILLFVIPVSIFFGWAAWPFIKLAWLSMEGSTETGGLPFVYILKSLLLLFPVTLVIASFVRLSDLLPKLLDTDRGAA